MFGAESRLKLGHQAQLISDLDCLLFGYADDRIEAEWTVSADDLPAAPFTGTLAEAKACAMKHRTSGGWARVDLGEKPIWAL